MAVVIQKKHILIASSTKYIRQEKIANKLHNKPKTEIGIN